MSKFRNFIITLNNPKTTLEELWQEEKMVYLCGQLEEGEKEGTPHFQMFCRLKTPNRVTVVHKLFPGGHVEIAHHPEKAREYCMKQDTRKSGPWEFGSFKKDGERGKAKTFEEISKLPFEEVKSTLTPLQLNAYHKSLSNIRTTEYLHNHYHLSQSKASEGIEVHERSATPCNNLWIYGETGSGKSTYARTKFPNAYIKSLNKWWDDYGGEKEVILEDVTKDDHAWLTHFLLLWADKWSFKGEIKGGQIMLQPVTFIVTSNYLPKDIWDSPATLKTLEAINRRFTFIKI